jgi:uncharacterized protein YdaU (DUF1376 family)
VKKSLPYVPWYHGDFLRSTPDWSLQERAVYWMLLCAQSETGPLHRRNYPRELFAEHFLG